MACSTFTSMTLDCRNSVGGVEELYIYGAGTASISMTATNGVVTTIEAGSTTLSDLASFEKFELLKQTASVGEEGSFSYENGTIFYTQTLSAVFNKIDGAKLNNLFGLAQGKLIVVAKSNDNKFFVLGNNNGAYVSGHSVSSGTAYGDRSGTTVTFEGISLEPMYEVNFA